MLECIIVIFTFLYTTRRLPYTRYFYFRIYRVFYHQNMNENIFITHTKYNYIWIVFNKQTDTLSIIFFTSPENVTLYNKIAFKHIYSIYIRFVSYIYTNNI